MARLGKASDSRTDAPPVKSSSTSDHLSYKKSDFHNQSSSIQTSMPKYIESENMKKPMANLKSLAADPAMASLNVEHASANKREAHPVEEAISIIKNGSMPVKEKEGSLVSGGQFHIMNQAGSNCDHIPVIEKIERAGIPLNKEIPNVVTEGVLAYDEIRKIIQNIRTVPFPKPSSGCERQALGFLCKLIETFQGALAIRYSEIPTTFAQIHNEPMNFKKYIHGMRSLMTSGKDTRSSLKERWEKLPSKFKDFLNLLPWFCLYISPYDKNAVWVLRTKDPAVKNWALKQSTISPFISAFAPREARIPFGRLVELHSHLFCVWNNGRAEGFSQSLLRKEIGSSWRFSGSNAPITFKYSEVSVEAKNIPNREDGAKDFVPEDLLITIPPLRALNRIGPCECSICNERISLDYSKKRISDDGDENIPSKRQSLPTEQIEESLIFERCTFNPMAQVELSNVIFGAKNVGCWSFSSNLYSLTCERLQLCKGTDYFRLKAMNS